MKSKIACEHVTVFPDAWGFLIQDVLVYLWCYICLLNFQQLLFWAYFRKVKMSLYNHALSLSVDRAEYLI